MPFQRELRDLSYVPRWSIVRVARPQSVAEHSYYTALYTGQICEMLNYGRDSLVYAALWHDVEECFTGDIPGPVKHQIVQGADEVIAQKMKSRFGDEWQLALGPKDRQIIKVASLIDDAMFLAGELQRGNNACEAAFANVSRRLMEEWFKIDLPEDRLAHGWRVLFDAIENEQLGYSVEPDL